MKKLGREKKKDVQRTLDPEMLKVVKGGDGEDPPPPGHAGIISWN
ncbi:MAG TPA: hypothetical protein VFE33_26980 [Thermoanaerobaculia bacterium]|nr:hypothetical protein [Thermoanaerobaculia bacterium]